MRTRKSGTASGGVRRRLWILTGLTVLLLLAVYGAPVICSFDPQGQDLSRSLQPPGKEHILGTDQYGRDVLARVLSGGRVSISSTFLLVAVISAFGSLSGVYCGLCGGWPDRLLMGMAELCLSLPGIILAMAIAAVVKGGVLGAVGALALVSWPKYARLARSRTLALKNSSFIYAARLAGDTPGQVVRRHLLPNILGTVLVTALLDIGTLLMELAGLSFLGLGAQPPAAEWGSMLSSGRSMLQLYPWLVLGPGLGIFITVVLFNLLGEALRDYLEVKPVPQSFMKQEQII